jgi:hypothetical protein
MPRDDLATAAIELIGGLEDMLSVAADAQLQGGSAGIDARNLVDTLDTMRRLAFALGNLSHLASMTPGDFSDPTLPATDAFDRAVRSRLDSWLANIRAQLEPGQLTIAPLRTMVSDAPAHDLLAALPLSGSPTDAARDHIARLLRTLEHQLSIVSLA